MNHKSQEAMVPNAAVDVVICPILIQQFGLLGIAWQIQIRCKPVAHVKGMMEFWCLVVFNKFVGMVCLDTPFLLINYLCGYLLL